MRKNTSVCFKKNNTFKIRTKCGGMILTHKKCDAMLRHIDTTCKEQSILEVYLPLGTHYTVNDFDNDVIILPLHRIYKCMYMKVIARNGGYYVRYRSHLIK